MGARGPIRHYQQRPSGDKKKGRHRARATAARYALSIQISITLAAFGSMRRNKSRRSAAESFFVVSRRGGVSGGNWYTRAIDRPPGATLASGVIGVWVVAGRAPAGEHPRPTLPPTPRCAARVT